MSKRIRRGLRAAINAARLSSFYSHRVGAVIFKGRRLISTGFNKKKTHPLLEELEADCYSQHAEFDAILKFLQTQDPSQITDAILFVARLTRTDRVSFSRPCEACQEVIEKFGLKRVYFTNYHGDMEELKAA